MELSPEHEQIREEARQRIAMYIAGQLTARALERPMYNIGMDDEVIS